MVHKGNDDNVNVSLTVDFDSGSNTPDVGIYMSVGGNSAMSGQCLVAVLDPGVYGTVTVSETNNNNCPDISGSGTLTDYPINNIIFPCYDHEGDGYLDFDLVLVYGGTPDDGGNGKTCHIFCTRVHHVYIFHLTVPSFLPSCDSSL